MSQATPKAMPTPGGSSKVRPPQKDQPQQNDELLEDEEIDEGSGLPPWFDVVAPWMASVVFHLGIGLLVLFMTWFIVKAAASIKEAEPIIIPTSFQDPGTPGGVPNPGEMQSSRDAAQDKIKTLKADGWSQSESPSSVASSLSGATGEQAADAIFRGSGGSTGGSGGNGVGGGGPISPYGTPGGGMGSGRKSNFFGSGGGGATRIVYLIDHSGSLLDNFDFLREEVKRSVNNLLPVQRFAVVSFAGEEEGVQVFTQSSEMERATSDAKHYLEKKMDEVVAKGSNDDLLGPFQKAFERAFSLKPQLIYFLTDGKYPEELMPIVDALNKDHKVRINTLAFVHEEPEFATQMKEMAKRSGGSYKFVSEQELGTK